VDDASAEAIAKVNLSDCADVFEAIAFMSILWVVFQWLYLIHALVQGKALTLTQNPPERCIKGRDGRRLQSIQL
jgi:hypothetical protein